MNRYIILLLLSVLFDSSISNGQIVETGSGQSTILNRGTYAGINLGESELSFTTNNYRPPIVDSGAIRVLWGVDVRGKNEEGLSNLFSKGSFVPNSSLRGTVGIYLSNSKSMIRESRNRQYITELQNKQEEAIITIDSILKSIRENHIDALTIDIIHKDKIKEDLADFLSPTYMGDIYKNYLDSLYFYALSQDISTIKTAITNIYIDSKAPVYEYREIIKRLEEEIRKEDKKTADYFLNHKFKRLILYGQLGLSGQKFNVFSGWDTTNFDNSFTEIKFRGNAAGIGANVRWGGKYFFGARYLYSETNNISDLTLTTYNRQNIQKTSTQSLTSSKEIKAYPSTYSRLYEQRIDLDILRYVPIDSTVLVLDFYMRHKWYNNSEIKPATTDLGIATLFYREQGKFLGGLYIELPDIDQNVERNKPEPQYQVWYKRLSFGVVAKFSIYSVFSVRNS